jgi:hypothetical protein
VRLLLEGERAAIGDRAVLSTASGAHANSSAISARAFK